MDWKKNYPKILLLLFLIIWIWAAISPKYRSVWIDENILPVLFVFLLIATYRWFRFSNTSYTLLFVFLVLHAIGGHWSYAEMPLFDWLKTYYDLQRNYYDRVVHFLFGVLFFVPVYEMATRIFKVPEGWRGFFVSFFMVAAFKGMFELIEYGYVWVRADPLNVTNYLGEQGDAYDALKDIGVGIFGGMISWAVTGVRRVLRRT